MKDRFAGFAPSLTSPVMGGFAITPSDSAALPELTRALYVGGAGDVALRLASGQAVVLKSVAAGTLLPMRVQSVQATGTTATALVGMV
ncbi:hypothetical protein ACEYYB_06025 [Paracoccus sp. p4-l81]|uniref:spike base protein, RCAP_Rcc01079 family n=1 Tax=unclassified Paracoccus (in: a-proteobacteria) TaxID=2688777 RepID=UPI0035B8C873